MKVSFKSKSAASKGTLCVFAAKGPELLSGAKELDGKSGGALKRAVKDAEFKGESGQILELLAPSGVDHTRVLLAGMGDGKALKRSGLESLGAGVAAKVLKADGALVFSVDVPKGCDASEASIAADIAFGATLATYSFDRYVTKDADKKKNKIKEIVCLVDNPREAQSAFAAKQALADGVFLARDLVNEPANILTPVEFASRIQGLTKLGVKVTVLGPREMNRMKMGSLMGVAQGSVNEPRLAVMEWKGGRTGDAPFALIGKGVTFDTGGISIKPAAGMEDMKGDMGGAAAVTGAMAAIAKRKAKANVVGLVGLVENMPDGNAQRPGDIVTSMSGQTIEVLNTDAEGRLVLADVFTYAIKTYKPKGIIDLATLTGAILVSLGHVHAGIFASDDAIADGLFEAGKETGERVWRLPLDPAYDKQLDSKIADMKNIGGPRAGSITAAQFLKRFTEDTPWCHIDIAGMAWKGERSAIEPTWGTGYGVRLLDEFVASTQETAGGPAPRAKAKAKTKAKAKAKTKAAARRKS